MAGWFKSLKPRTKFLGLIIGVLILAGIATGGYFIYKANVSASSSLGDTVCVASGDKYATYTYQSYNAPPGEFYWVRTSGNISLPSNLQTGAAGALVDTSGNRYYSAPAEKCVKPATASNKTPYVCFTINNTPPITYIFDGATALLKPLGGGSAPLLTALTMNIGTTSQQTQVNVGDYPIAAQVQGIVGGPTYDGTGGPCSGTGASATDETDAAKPGEAGATSETGTEGLGATGGIAETVNKICVTIDSARYTYERSDIPVTNNNLTYWFLSGTNSALPYELQIKIGENKAFLLDGVTGNYPVASGACPADASGAPQTASSEQMSVEASAFNDNGKQVTNVAFNYQYRNKQNAWVGYAPKDEITSGSSYSADISIPKPSDIADSGNNIEVVAYKNLDNGKRALYANKSEPSSTFQFQDGRAKTIKFTFSNMTDTEAAASANYSAAAAPATGPFLAGITSQNKFLPAGNANIILSASVLSLASPTSFTEAGGAEMTVHFYYPRKVMTDGKGAMLQPANIAYAADNPLEASADLVMVETTNINVTVLDKDGKLKDDVNVLLQLSGSPDEVGVTKGGGKYTWTDSPDNPKITSAIRADISVGNAQSDSQRKSILVYKGSTNNVTFKADASGKYYPADTSAGAAAGAGAGAGAVGAGTGMGSGGSGLGYQINTIAPYDKNNVQPFWGLGKDKFDQALSQLVDHTDGPVFPIHIPDEPYPVVIKGVAADGIVRVDVAKSGYATTSWWAKLTTGDNLLTNLPTALTGINPEPPKIKSGNIELIKAFLPNYHVYRANEYRGCTSSNYAIFVEEYPYSGWQCAEYDEKTGVWTKIYNIEKPNVFTSTGNYGIGMFAPNGEGLLSALGMPNTAAGRAQPCGMSNLISMGNVGNSKISWAKVAVGLSGYEIFRQGERAQFEQGGMLSEAANAQAKENAFLMASTIAFGGNLTIAKSSGPCYGANAVPSALMLNGLIPLIMLANAQGLLGPGSI